MAEYYENTHASQYGDMTFPYGTFVDARYVKAETAVDEGNKYIEALPVLPDKAGIVQRNFKKMPGYVKSVENKSELQKLLEVRQLEDLRIPLPSDIELWTKLYTSLIESYRRRNEHKSIRRNITNIIEDETVETDTKLISDGGSSTLGFHMIGESGCGKTSQVRIALDYYPRVIRHTNPDGSKTIQIPYLYIICPPSSNFKELYRSIGRELDKYLGNSDHQIEKDISGPSRRTVGEMLSKVIDYIERFAIGVIIFDEVQQISFTSQNENSFNALMAMVNRTNVALGLVGTSEAIAGIAKIEQIGRRVGIPISCDGYTKDREFFNDIFNRLEKYQWFDRRIKFSDEIRDEIYKESHGVIAYIVLIYMMIAFDYLIAYTKPEIIDLKYVKDIINRHFSLIRDTLNGTYLTKAERDRQTKILISKAIMQMDNPIQEMKDKEIKDLIRKQSAGFDAEEEFQDVLGRIRAIYDNDYTEETIRHQYDLYVKKYPEAEAKEIAKQIAKRLVKGNTDRRSTKKIKTAESVKSDTLASFVKSYEGDPNDPLG